MSFEEIGLTKYESAVYSAILRNGRSSADELSDISGVPITAVYPNLKNLEKKKLIQKISGETSLFEAISPKTAIRLWVNEKQKGLEYLKKQAIEEAIELANNKPAEKKKIVDITHGRDFSVDFYLEAFEKAKKSFFVLGWRFEKISDKYEFLHKFRKLIKKGVNVRIILSGKSMKNELIEDYKSAGIEIKYLPVDDFSIFIFDEKNCKLTIKKRGEERTNIIILDDSLSGFINSYFLDCWKKLKSFDYLCFKAENGNGFSSLPNVTYL